MNDDLYLSAVVDLYNNGIWNEEMVVKQVWMHAQELKLPKEAVDAFLARLLKKEEVKEETTTINDTEVELTDTKEADDSIHIKREYLRNVKYDDGNPKYGDDVDTLEDMNIEQLYDIEKRLEEEKMAEHEKNVVLHSSEESVHVNTLTVPENRYIVKPITFDNDALVNEENSVVNKQVEDLDEPEKEEDYQRIHDNTTNAEKDSDVRFVEVDNERKERLREKKQKVINYFIKGAIIVVAVALLPPIETIPLIGGYMYLSSRIKEGTFNPKTKVGLGIKEVIESIMNVGIKKEEGEEVDDRRRYNN